MGRLLAFILGVAGALVASQGPGFTLQYMQNLEGRFDEMTSIVEAQEAEIRDHGYTRETAMAECREATDLLDAFCSNYRMAVERLEYLTAHLDELNAASDYVRPLILARTYDRGIALSVKEQFEPAVPTSLHGIAYAGGGFIVGWGLPLLIFSLLGGMFGGGRR